MEITKVKVRVIFEGGPLKALVSVTFDDVFVVHDIKIVYTNDRSYVVMPSRKKQEGVYRDIAHPVTSEFRAVIEKAVLAEYEAELLRKKEEIEENAEDLSEAGDE